MGRLQVSSFELRSILRCSTRATEGSGTPAPRSLARNAMKLAEMRRQRGRWAAGTGGVLVRTRCCTNSARLRQARLAIVGTAG